MLNLGSVKNEKASTIGVINAIFWWEKLHEDVLSIK